MAGQGVSESSLAGCLYTGRQRHREKVKETKTQIRYYRLANIMSVQVMFHYMLALISTAEQKTRLSRCATGYVVYVRNVLCIHLYIALF